MSLLFAGLAPSVLAVAPTRYQINFLYSGNGSHSSIVLSSEYSLTKEGQHLPADPSDLMLNIVTPQTSTLRSDSLMQNLSTELRTPGNRLHPFTRLREDLFLDTMDIELLVAGLESKLEYYLTEEEASQIETVGDLQHFFLR